MKTTILLLLTISLACAAQIPAHGSNGAGAGDVKTAPQTMPPDPKDATIAYLQSEVEYYKKRGAMLLEMLLTKIKAETQTMQDRLNELDKQKPVVPVVPADSKAGEKK
jgi:hypothetical protein